MIQEPRILLIGSAGRNSGKTLFACRLIEKLRLTHPIYAAKVTAINSKKEKCPRGGEGCGVCSSLEGNFDIKKERKNGKNKDTQRMLAAGAHGVYWLRSMRDNLQEAATELIECFPKDALIICESNTFRTVVEPALFLMFRSPEYTKIKPSLKEVKHYADNVITFDGTDYSTSIDDVTIVDGKWAFPLDAGAIVMAGGKSRRMGKEKSMLLINGKPMIEQVCSQLRPHFSQLLISSVDADKYGFLNAPIIPDREAGHGPLMGIASALEESEWELNLVVACDVPKINMRVVRRMLREARGYDAVVPVTRKERLEPLFAVYRKSIAPALFDCLGKGIRRISDALEECNVNYMRLEEPDWPGNLNTPQDYKDYIS
jgi:molybdopterin-guanine dinucleotide biosynthesis protein A